MSEKFAVRRSDGRSNTQVVIDLVKDSPPGSLFDYDTLSEALTKDTDTIYDRAAVQGIVLRAVRTLQRLYQRTLKNERHLGYRLAHAHEHMELASWRNIKAERQMKMGLHLLTEVRRDEMSENQLKVHDGLLMIQSAMYHQMVAMERRLARNEKAIRDLQCKHLEQ